MIKTDWTAEEVQAKFVMWARDKALNTRDYETCFYAWLTAFAERIEADDFRSHTHDGKPVECVTNPPAQIDRARETPRRQQAVEMLLELGWTYSVERGWETPAQEQPGWKVPDGWRLVPIKATEKMRQEGAPHAGYEEEEAYSLDAVWAAMLAASPTPPKEK